MRISGLALLAIAPQFVDSFLSINKTKQNKDPNIEQTKNLSALYISQKNKQGDFSDKDQNDKEMFLSLVKDHPVLAVLQLNNGQDPNMILNDNGDRPLHLACKKFFESKDKSEKETYENLIENLISVGADTRLGNFKGLKPNQQEYNKEIPEISYLMNKEVEDKYDTENVYCQMSSIARQKMDKVEEPREALIKIATAITSNKINISDEFEKGTSVQEIIRDNWPSKLYKEILEIDTNMLLLRLKDAKVDLVDHKELINEDEEIRKYDDQVSKSLSKLIYFSAYGKTEDKGFTR